MHIFMLYVLADPHNIKMWNLKKQITTRYKVKVNHSTYKLHLKVLVVYERVFIIYVCPHGDIEWSTLD